MRKYADFECRKCSREIKNLPLDSQRCPVCGRKQGFKRLFNSIQVNVGRPRPARILEGKQDAHKFIDEQMRPAYDKYTAKKASAKQFEDAVKEINERIHEQATPEQRQAIDEHTDQRTGLRRVNMPVAQAFGAIDPLARAESREGTGRLLTDPRFQAKVKPLWQK